MNPLTKTYKLGMHLFHENDRSRELYIIQSGKIKVYRKIGGREVELAVLGKGSVLGEMALIDGKPRSASAKAVDECSVVLIDAETVHEKIKGVPPWFLSIIRMTSQKIRQANRRLQIISSEHQGASIVIALNYHFIRFDKGSGLDLTKTKQQLILLICATHQRVVKVLEFLSNNEFIQLNENTITCKDRGKFDEYCKFLRLYIRKSFEKMAPINGVLQQFIESLVTEKNSIVLNEEGSSELNGDELWTLIDKCVMRDVHADCMETLNELGILSIQKKETSDKSENPYAGTTIKISHAPCLRYYLYNKFNCLVQQL